MAFNQDIPKEYSKSINAVINFIGGNLTEDLSLEKLSSVANYSPFHFQKIFKQVTGESPKQYIVRTRLEAAAHSLIIQLEKPIKEIAIESGFTSGATFARAFKNYFGISAESLRTIPPKKRMELYKKGKKGQQLLDTDRYFKNVASDKKGHKDLHVVVKRVGLISGIFVTSSLEDTQNIENAFRKITQLADVNDLLHDQSMLVGIIYPHQRSYKAMISVKHGIQPASKLFAMEIPASKYATYKIRGDLEETFRTLKIFTEQWLPGSGYRLADIWGFEILSENPANTSYSIIEREMYVPLIPA